MVTKTLFQEVVCGSNGRTPGSVAISNDGQSFSDFLPFSWYHGFSISNMLPRHGSMHGGTDIAVSLSEADAADFSPFAFLESDLGYVLCRFNATIVHATIVDGRHLVCTSPPHEPGEVTVSISMNGEDWIHHADKYEYSNTYEVAKIAPTSGPSDGGTLLTVHVPALYAQVESVLCAFDGKVFPSTSVSIEDKEVYCTTPKANLSGVSAVAVEVSLNGLDFTSSQILFRYYNPPVVASIFPSVGQSNGNIPITVTGHGFFNTDSGPYCRFGDQIVVAKIVSSRNIYCEAPPLREIQEIQTFNISKMASSWYLHVDRCLDGVCESVSTIAQESASTLESALMGMPFMRKVSVSIRTLDVNTSQYGITFTHPTENEDVTCTVRQQINGNVEASLALVDRAHSIVNAGVVAVDISLNGFDFSSSDIMFEYQPLIVLDAIYPKHGPVKGGTLVYIRGSNFRNSSDLVCRFGQEQNIMGQSARYINASCIACWTPPSSGQQK